MCLPVAACGVLSDTVTLVHRGQRPAPLFAATSDSTVGHTAGAPCLLSTITAGLENVRRKQAAEGCL